MTAADLREIEEAVTASFRAHEDLVDPALAERIAERVRVGSGHGAGTGPSRAALLAAAAAVAGLIVLGANQFRGGGDPPAGSPTPSDPAARASTTAENLTAARAEVERLLRLVPTLPGSEPDATPPRAAFEKVISPGPPGGDRLADRELFLRAPGDLEQAARFYERLAPAGLVPARGWGDIPEGESAPFPFITISYTPAPGPPREAFVASGVDIDLIRYAAGIAARIRAHALARPGRVDGGFVTGEVTAVDVRPTIALTTTDPPAQRITDPVVIAELVRTVNTLPMDAPVVTPRGCGAILAGRQIGARLTLHRRGRPDVVVEADWACRNIVAIDGHPPLDGSDPRWLAVRAGLPTR